MLIVYGYAQTVGIYRTDQSDRWKNEEEETKAEYPRRWQIKAVHISSPTQDDIDQIANMEYLESLSLAFLDDGLDLSSISNLIFLREISISYIRDDNFDLSFIKDMSDLEKIEFYRCSALKDMSLFKNMPYLQTLYISNVDDVDLRDIRNCKSLKELHISGNCVRNADGLSSLTQLEALYLFDNQRYEDNEKKIPLDLEALADLSELQSLQLFNIKVTDVTPLSDLPALRDIVLENTDVNDVMALRKLKKLTYLAISGNTSEKVKKQVETYMKHVKTVTVTEEVSYGF